MSSDNAVSLPPKVIRPDFERMPPKLTQQKNWVLWRYLPPKSNGGKWRKVPVQPNGKPASATDETTWSRFDDCCSAYANGGYTGVGFVFDGAPDENGFVYAGVDFDSGAFKGDLTPFATEWIKRIGSYVEASVSGTGLHIIVKAHPLASGIAHGGIEMYTSKRYFTMTGRTVSAARPIIAAPEEFNALAQTLKSFAGKAPARDADPSPSKYDLTQFTAAERQRLQKFFGPLPDESLSDGIGPAIDEIESAVSAIPGAAIAAEPEWMKLTRGLAHHAAIYRKLADPLWEILDAASRRAPGYEAANNRARWERYIDEALDRENPITIATVFDMARQHGWQGWSPPIAATPTAPATSPQHSRRAVPIASLPRLPRKRQWLHGTDLIRGAVSMLVAPGARAKTTWLLTCALACAADRQLLDTHIFGGPLRVLYLSAEDSTDEISLRLRAAMQHHGVSDADVPGLHIIGADLWALPLLRAVRGAPELYPAGWDALTAELDQLAPDVLVIDPLINVMGGVDANNNSAAALLIGQLAALAAKRRMAVMIAHHASKGRDPTSPESAMGAASFVNLCRIALAIEPLTAEGAGKVGLPPWEAKSVFRVIGTKQNFSPPNADDRWFRLATVEVQNQQPPIYPNGDQVAVVEPFHPYSSGPAFPPALVRDALIAIGSANPPLSPSMQARARYAVPSIAAAIAQHRGGRESESEGKAVLRHLMDAGLVTVEEVKLTRAGGRSDPRQGLVLTPQGKAAMAVPQSPQCPAAALRENAGGAPPGAPATPGGCGGNAGQEDHGALHPAAPPAGSNGPAERP